MNKLLIFFAILNAFDAWTTWQVFRFGGRELNPILAQVINRLGLFWTLTLVKLGAVAIIWWAAFHGLTVNALLLINAGYVGLALWNYRQLQKQKGLR